MAEHIEREAVLSICREMSACEWNHRVSPVSWADAYEQFGDDVEEIPAADVVEVVRCKDCIKCVHDKIFGHYWCNRMNSTYKVKPDDFCSYGEQREGDTDA